MSENASDHGLGQGRGVLVGEQEGSCMAGGSMAQGPAVSIGQRGAADRAGRWGGDVAGSCPGSGIHQLCALG